MQSFNTNKFTEEDKKRLEEEYQRNLENEEEPEIEEGELESWSGENNGFSYNQNKLIEDEAEDENENKDENENDEDKEYEEDEIAEEEGRKADENKEEELKSHRTLFKKKNFEMFDKLLLRKRGRKPKDEEEIDIGEYENNSFINDGPIKKSKRLRKGLKNKEKIQLITCKFDLLTLEKPVEEINENDEDSISLDPEKHNKRHTEQFTEERRVEWATKLHRIKNNCTTKTEIDISDEKELDIETIKDEFCTLLKQKLNEITSLMQIITLWLIVKYWENDDVFKNWVILTSDESLKELQRNEKLTIREYKYKICDEMGWRYNVIQEYDDEQIVQYTKLNGEIINITKKEAKLLDAKKEEINRKDIDDFANKKNLWFTQQAEDYTENKDKIQIKLRTENALELPDDKEGFTNLKGGKSNTKSFGIVVYMTKSEYDNENIENNQKIHFKNCKTLIGLSILKWFKSFGQGTKHPVELRINHEHGDKNYKCHCQCYLEFKEKLQCQIYPAEFNIGDNNYICMSQKAKEPEKLINYCAKQDKYREPWDQHEDFIFNGESINEYLENKNVNTECKKIVSRKGRGGDDDDTVDECLMEIYNTQNLDGDKLLDILRKAEGHKNYRSLAALVFNSWEKILKLNKEIVSRKPKIQHKWHLPEYITIEINEYRDKYMTYIKPGDHIFPKGKWILKENIKEENINIDERQRYRIFTTIQDWFFRYCIKNDREDHSIGTRKKALCIWGERGIGKTILCKSLLEDPNTDPNQSEFIVYCKNKIVAADFTSKRTNGQLVIFDDVAFLDSKQKEMVKNIMVGQTCRILSNYHDEDMWEFNCPCIILTNSFYTYDWFCTSSEWKLDMIKIGCKSTYLGPKGTQEIDDRRDECYDTVETIEYRKQYKKMKEEAKEKIFNK